MDKIKDEQIEMKKHFIGATSWHEVAVWKAGGNSAASLRKEEWEEMKMKRIDAGQEKELQEWVCGGFILNKGIMENRINLIEDDTGDITVDPSRWAIQYGITSRQRDAVPWNKLAVKKLYDLSLSRIYRPMRTFDKRCDRPDVENHTSWTDLLSEKCEVMKGGDDDGVYAVLKIVTHRVTDDETWFLVRWAGYASSHDTWHLRKDLPGCEALKEYDNKMNHMCCA